MTVRLCVLLTARSPGLQFAEECSARTSVRRKRRCHKILLPGSKAFLLFSQNPVNIAEWLLHL